MDILEMANSIINDIDIESMFKIINQDNDDHFNYTEKSQIWYEGKYAEYKGKQILMGFNIYAKNPEDKEPFLLGTYENSHQVIQVMAEIFTAMQDGIMYYMPESEGGDIDV